MAKKAAAKIPAIGECACLNPRDKEVIMAALDDSKETVVRLQKRTTSLLEKVSEQIGADLSVEVLEEIAPEAIIEALGTITKSVEMTRWKVEQVPVCTVKDKKE